MASLLDEKQGGQQFTIDANAVNLQYVNASILINNLEKRVQLYNYAIFNKTQEMIFNFATKSYSSKVEEIKQMEKDKGLAKKKDQKKKEKLKQISILGISLDDLFPPEVLPEVHLMKFDVEAADLMGIQGAHNIIRRSKDIVIIME